MGSRAPSPILHRSTSRCYSRSPRSYSRTHRKDKGKRRRSESRSWRPEKKKRLVHTLANSTDQLTAMLHDNMQQTGNDRQELLAVLRSSTTAQQTNIDRLVDSLNTVATALVSGQALARPPSPHPCSPHPPLPPHSPSLCPCSPCLRSPRSHRLHPNLFSRHHVIAHAKPSFARRRSLSLQHRSASPAPRFNVQYTPSWMPSSPAPVLMDVDGEDVVDLTQLSDIEDNSERMPSPAFGEASSSRRQIRRRQTSKEV
jgi:hypothetical protein